MRQNDESGSPVTGDRHVTDEQYAAAPTPRRNDARLPLSMRSVSALEGRNGPSQRRMGEQEPGRLA
jgi:hypothetical protein